MGIRSGGLPLWESSDPAGDYNNRQGAYTPYSTASMASQSFYFRMWFVKLCPVQDRFPISTGIGCSNDEQCMGCLTYTTLLFFTPLKSVNN